MSEKRYWNRSNDMTDGIRHSTLHHFYKYHDPDSEFYIGEDCVNCEFSDIQRDVRAKGKEETYRKALDAIWRWCQLQPGDVPMEAVCHIEELVESALGMKDPNFPEWWNKEMGVIEFKSNVDAVNAMHVIQKVAGEIAKNMVAAKAANEKGGHQ